MQAEIAIITSAERIVNLGSRMESGYFKRDNGNVHRAAVKIIVSKSRAARGSVCNVLLSRVFVLVQPDIIFCQHNVFPMLRPSEAIIHAVVTGKN